MAGYQRAPKAFAKMFRLICLAYIALSYVLICIYVAPPFTLIGDDTLKSFDLADWVIVLLFVLFVATGALARIPSITVERRRAMVGTALLTLLASALLLVVCTIVGAWLAPDAVIKRHYLSRATGMLGIGWLLLLYLAYVGGKKAVREEE